MDRRVVALIPAHNEENFIAGTLSGVKTQTVPADRIIVVADNCTDGTAGIARENGAEVFETTGNKHKKAGALNQVLSALLHELDDDSLILIQDGDTVLNPEFIETAIRNLKPGIGGVCARYNCAPGGGLIGLFQRNEFARARQRTIRKKGATPILVGIAVVFPPSILREIVTAREAGKLPGRPEVYNVDSITEDYELSLALKHLGYQLISPDGCDPVTDVMLTVRALWHQRIRWYRGALDDLRRYGWSKVTRSYILKQAGWVASMLMTPLFLSYLIMLFSTTGDHIHWSLPWASINLIFVAERVISLRKEGIVSVLVSASLIPEIIFEAFLSIVYFRAAIKHLRGSAAQWVAT